MHSIRVASPLATLSEWTIYRCTPDEVLSPETLSPCHLVWEGHSETPLISTLLEEPKPDEHDWWFVTTLRPRERSSLIFPEVCGVAELWIDGELDRCFDNAFLSWEVALDPSRNAKKIALRFRALTKLLEKKQPRPRWSSRLINHQQWRWIRQPLLGRLNGWGDECPRVGLGSAVYLERADVAHVSLRTQVVDDAAWIDVNCRTVGKGGRLEVKIAGHVFGAELLVDEAHNYAGKVSASLEGLDRWYPHTHGNPALYVVDVFLNEELIFSSKVGFRTLTLDTVSGELLVNGRSVFVRGANYFQVGSQAEQDRMLAHAVNAGFNMLRLPGTTQYATDKFLEACDHAGLMVWQDLPMASLDYPDTAEFAQLIAQELDQQLPRLVEHPCIAVICGGSDREQQATYQGLAANRRTSTTLYGGVAERVRTLASQIPFVGDTPTGGNLPTHTDSGFSSYFGIGAYRRSVDDRGIDRVRFATECLGFANIPDADSLKEMFGSEYPSFSSAEWKRGVPRDAAVSWDFDDVRDHYVETVFGESARELRSSDTFRYVEVSRIITGHLMALTLGRWRSTLSRCRGMLIWTLNDLAPGGGWGLVDSLGRPKAALHLLSAVCRPLQVVLTDEGLDGHEVHMINETSQQAEGELEVALIRMDGRKGPSCRVDVRIEAGSTVPLSVDAMFGRFQDTTWSHRFAAQEFSAITAVLRCSGKITEYMLDVGRPSLSTDLAEVGATIEGVGTERTIRIISTHLLRWVRVDAPGWQIENNYVHVFPGVVRTIKLSGNSHPEVSPAPKLRPFCSKRIITCEVISSAA